MKKWLFSFAIFLFTSLASLPINDRTHLRGLHTCGKCPRANRFEVVGIGTNPASRPAAAAITLDAIARWIYQDNLCR